MKCEVLSVDLVLNQDHRSEFGLYQFKLTDINALRLVRLSKDQPESSDIILKHVPSKDACV